MRIVQEAEFDRLVECYQHQQCRVLVDGCAASQNFEEQSDDEVNY